MQTLDVRYAEIGALNIGQDIWISDGLGLPPAQATVVGISDDHKAIRIEMELTFGLGRRHRCYTWRETVMAYQYCPQKTRDHGGVLVEAPEANTEEDNNHK